MVRIYIQTGLKETFQLIDRGRDAYLQIIKLQCRSKITMKIHKEEYTQEETYS